MRAVAAPIERFLHVEAASGIVLIGAAALALIVANSPLAASVEAIWRTELGLPVGPFPFTRDVRWWVNDGLMTIFFFVVGLELRRETHRGELSDLRRAALPIAAAIGGMVVPAVIYALFNHGTPNAGGWGVPMATDIAFAVGVLALLGRRVPPALRVLLLALAVIDDLGAILVIALFYSSGVQLLPLGLAGLGVLAVLGLLRLGVRRIWLYLPVALFIWGATYASGIHPTIAGVVLGLMVPVTPWAGAGVAESDTQVAASPVEQLEAALHGWVAWGIMPVFAFANAGVSLGALSFEGGGWRVFVGVAAGLVVGKAVGVMAATRLAAAVGVAALPAGVRWVDVSVVGGVAGIGFTMALFIAQLAFPAGSALEVAKFAILIGSAVAGVLGYLLGRVFLPTDARQVGAKSEAEAEASAEV